MILGEEKETRAHTIWDRYGMSVKRGARLAEEWFGSYTRATWRM
jgi:hypothetical protein